MHGSGPRQNEKTISLSHSRIDSRSQASESRRSNQRGNADSLHTAARTLNGPFEGGPIWHGNRTRHCGGCTLAGSLVMAGDELGNAAELLGHKSIQMTVCQPYLDPCRPRKTVAHLGRKPWGISKAARSSRHSWLTAIPEATPFGVGEE